MHRARHPVQGNALDHARQAQGVVAVKMRNQNVLNLGSGQPRKDHLALGALARIEEEPVGIPAQKIGIMITVSGGNLAGGAQNHQFTRDEIAQRFREAFGRAPWRRRQTPGRTFPVVSVR